MFPILLQRLFIISIISRTNGWIDRGGYHPQEFGGSYFYSQADSLLFKFTDDIELMVDFEKREVAYRSAARLGVYDWDTQRLRYNQFARMLAANGGWEVNLMPNEDWLMRLPFHWTQQMLDGVVNDLKAGAEFLQSSTGEGSSSSASPPFIGQEAVDGIRNLLHTIEPYFKPIVQSVEDVERALMVDPKVAAAIQVESVNVYFCTQLP